jgi:hypothetical protein
MSRTESVQHNSKADCHSPVQSFEASNASRCSVALSPVQRRRLVLRLQMASDLLCIDK